MWQHRNGGATLYLLRTWKAIALALIGVYAYSFYTDSYGNWTFSISTAQLGLYELLFFIVATCGMIIVLFQINWKRNKVCKDEIKNKLDENLSTTGRISEILESRNPQIFQQLIPGLKDAIDHMKINSTYAYLTDIRKESLIYFKKDYSLLSSVEYLMGDCARYLKGKDCRSHYKEAYDYMKKAGEQEPVIIEAMVYTCCLEKDYEKANRYITEIQKIANNSIWEYIPKLLQAEDLSLAVSYLPSGVDTKKALANVIMLGGSKSHDLGVDIQNFEYSNLDNITPDNFPFWILDLSVALTRFVRAFCITTSIKSLQTDECRTLFLLSQRYLDALKKTDIENLIVDIEFIHSLTGYIQDRDRKRIEDVRKAKYTSNLKELYYLGLSFMMYDQGQDADAITFLKTYGVDVPFSVLNMRLQCASRTMRVDEIVSVFNEAADNQSIIPDHLLNLVLGMVRVHHEQVALIAKKLNLENPLSKRVLNEYCDFINGEEHDIEWLRGEEKNVHPIFLPFIAIIYKKKLGLDAAISTLKKCIDITVLDLRTMLMVDFLSEDKSRTSQLYHFLKDLRQSVGDIKKYDVQLLAKELYISELIPDYNNSREVTAQLMILQPDNDSIVAHHIIALAGCGNKENEIRCFKQRLKDAQLNTWELANCFEVFLSIGEAEFAVDKLYREIKKTNDQGLKDFYIQKHLHHDVDSIVSKEESEVRISDYVTIEINGEEKEVEVTTSSVYECLVGKHVGDIQATTIKEQSLVKIKSIHNKYHKLLKDIFKELSLSNSSKNIKMYSTDDFDFESDPLGALAKMAGRTKDVIAEENRELENYKKAETPLLNLVRCPGSFADLYDKFFGNFYVYTHPTSVISNFFKGDNDVNNFDVVLDITSLILMHEVYIRFGLSSEKKFLISNGLYNFLKMEIYNEENGSYSFFSTEIQNKLAINIHDETKTPLWNKLYMIKDWVDKYCEVCVVEEKLDIDMGRKRSTLGSLELEAVLLARRGNLLLTEDWSYIKLIIKLIPSMSVHNWLSLTKNEHSGQFSDFMLDNGNIGYPMKASYIYNQYDLLAKGIGNNYNVCLENISKFPESPLVVMEASKLMWAGIITPAKRLAVVNILTVMFKAIPQNTAKLIIAREAAISNDKEYIDCLLEALRIAHPILLY